MVVDGALSIGGTLIATGRCSLVRGNVPKRGTLLGGTHSLLKYDSITLVLENGQKSTIVPRRIEFLADQPPLLVFDVMV